MTSPANSFHEGPLPAGFTMDFEPALFNLPEFLTLQSRTHWLSFYVLNMDRRKVTALMHVHSEGESAQSPLRGPFGSVESVKGINPQVLYDFLTYVERRLKAHGIRELVIKNPPRAYDPEFISLLETCLINLDFMVAIAEPGAVIQVGNTTFAEGLPPSEFVRKRNAQNSGLQFEMLSPADLDEVYRFIAACHEEKGYKVSISHQQLSETVSRFPGRYLLSVVREAGVIRAASVSIRVKENILYNFLVNHEKSLNRLSPPILLMEGLYEYCQQNGIGLFDLGTSALAGKPNFSLLDFKLRMGARPTSKFSFYKRIS